MPLLHPHMKCYLILRPWKEKKANKLIENSASEQHQQLFPISSRCFFSEIPKRSLFKLALNMGTCLGSHPKVRFFLARPRIRGFIDPSWPLEKVDRFIRAIYFPPFSAARLRLEVGGEIFGRKKPLGIFWVGTFSLPSWKWTRIYSKTAIFDIWMEIHHTESPSFLGIYSNSSNFWGVNGVVCRVDLLGTEFRADVHGGWLPGGDVMWHQRGFHPSFKLKISTKSWVGHPSSPPQLELVKTRMAPSMVWSTWNISSSFSPEQ